jgi:hypothetical protein
MSLEHASHDKVFGLGTTTLVIILFRLRLNQLPTKPQLALATCLDVTVIFVQISRSLSP